MANSFKVICTFIIGEDNMNYYQIYWENEGKYISINNQKFRNFLKDFIEKTGLMKVEVLNFGQDYTELYYRIREFVLTKHPEYIPLFYQMLEERGFNMDDEILLLIRTIGKEMELQEETKEYFLLSLYIEEIEKQADKYIIHSKQLGDYAFYTAYQYLINNPLAKNLLNTYFMEQNCHYASWELMKCLDGASLITCLLPSYFEGEYYHSIVQDKTGAYIDLAYGVVYDKETGDKLFLDKIISSVKKEDMAATFSLAKQKEATVKSDLPPTLILALYNKEQKLQDKLR